MKKTVTLADFRDEFVKYDRYDTFSYKGYEVLFNYFEELEEDCGEELELDVIALCCEWSEEPLEDILDNYNLDSLEELEDNTTVLHVEGGMYIYQAY